jgi:hypothetical protein
LKPKKFRKKPVVIDALPFDGSNHDDIKRFTQGGCYIDANDPQNPRLMIRTLEGEHVASPGDVIIRGVKGEFYPCKPDIFAMTYEDDATRSDSHLLRSHEALKGNIVKAILCLDSYLRKPMWGNDCDDDVKAAVRILGAALTEAAALTKEKS